jgi:Cu(I)/Ag(I) efflux system membrane fusion protein
MTLRVPIARRIGVALGVLLAAGVLAPGCRRAAEPDRGTATPAARHHCPMHPTYTSDHPGDCPICGMKLVPIQAGEAPAAGSSVPERSVVTLTTERRQMLGVRTTELRPASLAHEIRTVGRVTTDERRLHHVHTKFEAYVEHLHVDFTGKFVRRGEPLLSLYAPELVATQEEYLLAWRAQKQLEASGIPSVARGGVDLLDAARQRLLFWDISPADIERLQQTGRVTRTLDLYADASGYVVQKNVVHGMRVTPEMTLFDIADLSHLWVLADVYESDLPAVRVGMRAELSVPYVPDRAWRGPVTWVAPTVDAQARTIKVRVEVDNEGDALKPDMFADVLLKSDLGTGLIVPDDAVIHAGERDVVFLDRGQGRFEPIEVELGAKVRGGFHVLRGLAPGDHVVVAANFLLDSESSLKAALVSLGSSTGSAAGASPAPHRH